MPSDETASERTPLLQQAPNAPTRDTENTEVEAQNGANDTTAPTSPSDKEYTTPQLLLLMSGVYIGAFLASLDSTLIATLMTPISASFSSLTLYSWLSSSYFIANAASQPLAGKLTDIYGRRYGMVLSHTLFGVGNLICGLAKSEAWMIFGRVVAGLGGGGIGPIATVLASDVVPLRQRAMWQGFANVCFGVGSGLGGPLGGLINDKLGWRWAFLVQIPLTLVGIVLTAVFQKTELPAELRKDGVSKFKRIDFAGALLLVSTLVLLLLGLNAGGNVVPWSHPLVLASVPLSGVLLVAFCVYESRYAIEPILPVGLMTDRTILFSCLSLWFVTAARFGLLFYAPVLFYAQGLSSSAVGLKLIPDSVAVGVSAIVVGAGMRATGRYYFLGLLVGLLFIVGVGLTVVFSFFGQQWLPFVAFACIGFGYNSINTVTIIAMIAAKEHKHQVMNSSANDAKAVITSMSYAFRSTGSTLGITLASVVFQNLFSDKLRDRLSDGKDTEKIIESVRRNFEAIRKLKEPIRSVVQQVCTEALRASFTALFITAVLGAAMLAFIREYKLHRTIKRDDDS